MLPISPPAGGAAATQVLIGGAASSAVTAGLLGLGLAHRSGRTAVLARVARTATRLTGLPGWAAVPLGTAMLAFAVAGFGFVWDVSYHVDNGRDTGPFGTPAHFFLLAGIFGFLAAGWFAIVLAPSAPPGGAGSPAAGSWVRLREGWFAPTAGLVMLACSAVALLGFPLDDLWHRMFGQDVTLWGPTHQLMINGGILTFAALLMLLREARTATAVERARPAGRPARARRRRLSPAAILHAAVLLTGMTLAYEQEFGFGIPEYRLLFQPLLIVLSCALVLVPARLLFGRGGAFATTLAALGLLGALTVLVGPVAGQATHHFPLFVPEAVLVELGCAACARLRAPAASAAAVCGVLLATGGVAAELGWSHLWMPIAWPPQILGEAIVRALPVAVAAAWLGAWVAGTLRGEAPGRLDRAAVRWGAIGVIVASLAALLPTHADPLRATARLSDVRAAGASGGTVMARVRVSDPAALRGADWLEELAWQGHENRRVVGAMRVLSPGVIETTVPLPVGGTWKAMIRIARGSVMESVPIYLPADRAIGAPEVPALGTFTRPFAADRVLLQRERRHDVPGWLFRVASALVAAVVLALIGLLAWALTRIAAASSHGTPTAGRDRPGSRSRTAQRGASPSPAAAVRA